MTLAATVVGDLHRDTGALADLDPESDVGFFAMSPAGAEQVTQQIRSVLDRGWEYIALAYKGRAFTALGYPTWDAYADARFGDFRIAVPREHRAEAVAALAGVRMSVRAIAKLLGVGVGTVHREMAQLSGVPNGTPDEANGVGPTLGRNGKSYPRRRPSIQPCGSCGDRHDGAQGCPWDLVAQGVGPCPTGRAQPTDNHSSGSSSVGSDSISRGETRDCPDDVDATTTDNPGEIAESSTLVVDRLDAIVDQLDRLSGVLDELAEFATSPNVHALRTGGLPTRLRPLLDRLGARLDASATTIRRLQAIVA